MVIKGFLFIKSWLLLPCDPGTYVIVLSQYNMPCKNIGLDMTWSCLGFIMVCSYRYIVKKNITKFNL